MHPLQLLSAGTAKALDGFAGVANVVLFIACAVEIVLRYRRSSGDERAQLKWFAAATVVAAFGFTIGIVAIPTGPAAVFALLTPLIPIAAGIAILKYRLYDIDVVISKTVVVALLAVFIAAVYIAIVVGIGTPRRKHDEPRALDRRDRPGGGAVPDRCGCAHSGSRTDWSTASEPRRTR